MSNYYVIGASHIDLAFVMREDEQSELIEIFVERMLNILERNPELHFALEQISHYRRLEKSRPDLFNKIKELIKENRIEMMGAMASTLETNFPNGECFVRNQLMGLIWAKEHLETVPDSAWLIDTFGINAQVPQILKQFGFEQLFANRFGGDKRYDIFYDKGIDGSKIMVIGKDSASKNVLPNSQAFIFCRNWNDIDLLFRVAENLQGDLPRLVAYYIENEEVLSEYYIKRTKELDGKDGNRWKLSSYKEYVKALKESGYEAPTLWGDLNPEFTGTFALRNQIHIDNRAAETVLLEADKWTALLNCHDNKEDLKECWWTIFFNQFHDVFTGSHEDKTYFSVLDKFRYIRETSNVSIENSLNTISRIGNSLLCVNGLPWKRNEWIRLEGHDSNVMKVYNKDELLPMAYEDGKAYFYAEIPPTAIVQFDVRRCEHQIEENVATLNANIIQNEYMSLCLDKRDGIKSLTLSNGLKIMENVSNFLVAQEDLGGLQIEEYNGNEIFAMDAATTISKVTRNEMGESIALSGEFSKIRWNKGQNKLKWNAKFSLRKGEAALRLHLSIDWVGEATRIRLKLPCLVNSAKALYEIPFGVVERSAYDYRETARGEWPAHRFVAYEDGTAGLALVNNGVAGVELIGQTLVTTLIRAYGDSPNVWIKPTAVSSQHGTHEYDFMIIPYNGTWKEANVIKLAQEFNNSINVFENREIDKKLPNSFFEIEQPNLVLASIKFAEDHSEDVIIRYYETYGEQTLGTLRCFGADKVYQSDMRESFGDELACDNGIIKVKCNPFEIQTLRIVCKK